MTSDLLACFTAFIGSRPSEDAWTRHHAWLAFQRAWRDARGRPA